jgi:hydroxyethylthiazole kinase
MTIAVEEVGAFVKSADGLLVNLGTFDAERRAANAAAIDAASEQGIPWVLDPVFIDRSEPRAAYARELVGRGPKAIRLNEAEFAALTGVAPNAAALATYAGGNHAVVALTGKTDLVSDGEHAVKIDNGHPLMTQVSALGCAASALVAACLAVERDALNASAAALLIIGIAGEAAAKHARGPGSFAVDILDVLNVIDRNAIIASAKVG